MYGITQKETTEYVAKYIKDRYGKEMSPDELFNKQPWHKIVWQKFHANAYYGTKNYYFSWDDVPEPEEGSLAYIISKDILERYQYKNGKWNDLGSANAECWK
jgi:hypothetical protein